MFLCVPPTLWLSKRLGKDGALKLGTGIVLLAPLMSWFIYTPAHPWLQLAFLLPLGPACAALMTFPGAMLADLVDLDELKTGCRREGSFMSLFGFLGKASLPVSTCLFGLLLDHFARFVPGAPTQSPETVVRLRLILLGAPMLPFILGLLLAWIYPIREADVREARRLLNERRGAPAEAVASTEPVAVEMLLSGGTCQEP